MSSVSGIRLPGLATGMDTDAMIKEMLTGEQNKVDKVKQKEQTIKWQQEIYREVIKDIQGLNDKYFSITSKNSIIKSSAWNTLTVSSTNPGIITATGSSSASAINYKFEVSQLATSGKASSTTSINGKINKDSSLKDLGLVEGTTEFSIRYGKGENEVSSKITIRTEDKYKVDVNGDFVYEKDQDGKDKLDENGQPIKIIEEPADTVETLINKINNAGGGNIKASYSEMTGEFIIEDKNTGSNNGFTIVEKDGKTSSGALDFLNLSGKDATGKFSGTDSKVTVSSTDATFTKDLVNASNSFSIDGITYNLHSAKVGEIVELTSKQDVQPVVDNMKSFVEDYNKLMDKMYNLVIQKANKDYQPLTEEQKKDMSEEEVEKWESKAKEGILRNDPEMRRFIDDMQKSIFGDNTQVLSAIGLTSHENYNKKGQISLNDEKFMKALETNADKIYELLAKDSSSVMEKIKSTIKDYVGTSTSVFARKSGIEKTASVANNFYSEQLKRQADAIKIIQRKMDSKESNLYKKFSTLEASMNKLNSQMNYFSQM